MFDPNPVAVKSAKHALTDRLQRLQADAAHIRRARDNALDEVATLAGTTACLRAALERAAEENARLESQHSQTIEKVELLEGNLREAQPLPSDIVAVPPLNKDGSLDLLAGGEVL